MPVSIPTSSKVDWPHRKTKFYRGGVNMFDAFAFSQHPNRLIDIWRKNSVNIKPGFITDDYRGFTLFFASLTVVAMVCAEVDA